MDIINATKTHELSEDMDTNYFLDADISILGSESSMYEKYTQYVRKEYKIVPSFLYNKGRKKVLKHFLEMDKIYKTEYYYSKYEKQARINLRKELSSIG